jgi:hypothetical protein
MKSLIPLLLLPIAALGAPTTPSQRARDAQQVQVTSISVSGSGCPQGTITTDISPEGTVLTLGFDSYQTAVGPGVRGSDREKNCDVFITLRYPLGCTSTTVSTTYHGFAQLEDGVEGSFPATYSLSPGFVSGGPPATTFSAGEWGTGGVYTKLDEVAVKEDIRHANQRDVSFVIRNRIRLNAAGSDLSGTLTVDDATVIISDEKSC